MENTNPMELSSFYFKEYLYWGERGVKMSKIQDDHVFLPGWPCFKKHQVFYSKFNLKNSSCKLSGRPSCTKISMGFLWIVVLRKIWNLYSFFVENMVNFLPRVVIFQTYLVFYFKSKSKNSSCRLSRRSPCITISMGFSWIIVLRKIWNPYSFFVENMVNFLPRVTMLQNLSSFLF